MRVVGFTSSLKKKEKKTCLHTHIHLSGNRDEASIGLDGNLSNNSKHSKMGLTNVTSECPFTKRTIEDFTFIKLYKYICFRCMTSAASKKDSGNQDILDVVQNKMWGKLQSIRNGNYRHKV